jgi:hypothetical protein
MVIEQQAKTQQTNNILSQMELFVIIILFLLLQEGIAFECLKK